MLFDAEGSGVHNWCFYWLFEVEHCADVNMRLEWFGGKHRALWWELREWYEDVMRLFMKHIAHIFTVKLAMLFSNH